MSTGTSIGLTLAGICVGVGIAAAGFFASQTTLNGRTGANTATVKGLSERRVTADRAVWRIGYSEATSDPAQVPARFARTTAHRDLILSLLREQGFSADETFAEAVERLDNTYRDNFGAITEREIILRGAVTVETANVAAIAPARLQVAALIADNVPIENGTPRYSFGGLNAIKPDMLREATANARVAAQEFADNAGVDVGAIKLARQGGFTIRDAGEEYSEFERIDKDVRVVTTIEFYLTE